jgi:hypothetical protein
MLMEGLLVSVVQYTPFNAYGGTISVCGAVHPIQCLWRDCKCLWCSTPYSMLMEGLLVSVVQYTPFNAYGGTISVSGAVHPTQCLRRDY